jgi:hypothetical protein
VLQILEEGTFHDNLNPDGTVDLTMDFSLRVRLVFSQGTAGLEPYMNHFFQLETVIILLQAGSIPEYIRVARFFIIPKGKKYTKLQHNIPTLERCQKTEIDYVRTVSCSYLCSCLTQTISFGLEASSLLAEIGAYKQGCQIFLKQFTQTEINTLNDHKIYQMAVHYN